MQLHNSPEIHRRMALLGLLITLAFVGLMARALHLQLIDGDLYTRDADEVRVIRETISPRRGRILDRNGAPIADSRIRYHAAVVLARLELPRRQRRDLRCWKFDEQHLGALLAALSGRVRGNAGDSLRELVVRELTDDPGVAVAEGPSRDRGRIGLVVLDKAAINPLATTADDSLDLSHLAEGDELVEDPVTALERELSVRRERPLTLLPVAVFEAMAAALDRDLLSNGTIRARDLLDPFCPAFTVSIPTSPPGQPAMRRDLALRLLDGSSRPLVETAIGNACEAPANLVHERLERALAEARAAQPVASGPVFYGPSCEAERIAARLPRGTLVQDVALSGIPGARERLLVLQGDPPDGDGWYSRLIRRLAENLRIPALELQALVETHGEALTPARAEQVIKRHLVLLDPQRVQRFCEGLSTVLAGAGRPMGIGELESRLTTARRQADRGQRGSTWRDPIRLIEDLPPALAIRLAGRDSAPPPEIAQGFDDCEAELPGLAVTTSAGRSYPNPGSLCHTLGTVADDTLGTPTGQWGLEAHYDALLRGAAGSRLRVRTADGNEKATIDPPLDGQDLTTEIDLETQLAAEDALEHAYDLAQELGTASERMERARSVGRGRGGLVMIDCQTGGIITLASNPRYTYEQYARDYTALANDPGEPLIDHAAVPDQPPGSSFKILTALACLEYGVINPGASIYCQGFMGMDRGRKILRDHAPAGSYDLTTAIQISSNVYFATIGAKLGAQRLYEIGSKVGLGRNNALDVPQQRPGILPDPQRIRLLRPREPRWQVNDTWRMAIGQFATASPLQCAAIAAAVANGGHIVRPYLVRPAAQPEVVDLHIRKEWLDDLRHGMELVTANQPGSTAKLLVLHGGAAGIKVAAKTGTAEWGSSAQREAGKRPDHAWMIGYAPADNPTVAFACFIHSGTFGGQACTPVVKKVLETYFADGRR